MQGVGSPYEGLSGTAAFLGLTEGAVLVTSPDGEPVVVEVEVNLF